MKMLNATSHLLTVPDIATPAKLPPAMNISKAGSNPAMPQLINQMKLAPGYQLPLIDVEGKERYTQIPNGVLKALWRPGLTSSEYRVLAFIFRLTYGWHRLSAETSARQIGRVIGMDLRLVRRSLTALKKKKIIDLKHTAGNQTGKGVRITIRLVDKPVNSVPVQGVNQPPVQGVNQPPVQGVNQPPARFAK